MKQILLAIALWGFLACGDDSPPERDKFLGAYSAIETCPTGSFNYDIIIIESSDADNAILISNFFGAVVNVKALVNGNTFTVPNQVLNVAGNSVIINSGNGSLSGKLLTVSYGYSIGTATQNCTMICTKK